MFKASETDHVDLMARMERLQSRLKKLNEEHPADKKLASPQSTEKMDAFLLSFYGTEIKEDTDEYYDIYFDDSDEEIPAPELTTEKRDYFIKKITFLFEQGFYKLSKIPQENLPRYKTILEKFTERWTKTDLGQYRDDIQEIISPLEAILFYLQNSSFAERSKIIKTIFSEILCLPDEDIQYSLQTLSKHLSQNFDVFDTLKKQKHKMKLVRPAVVIQSHRQKTEKNPEIGTIYNYQYIYNFLCDFYKKKINLLESNPNIIYDLNDFFILRIFPQSYLEYVTRSDSKATQEKETFLKKLPGYITVLLKTLHILPIYDSAYRKITQLIADLKTLDKPLAEEKKLANLEETLNFSDSIGKDLNISPNANVKAGKVIQTAVTFNRKLSALVMLALEDPYFKLPQFNATAMTFIIKINELVSAVVSTILLNKEHYEPEFKTMIQSAISAYSHNPEELPTKYKILYSAVEKCQNRIAEEGPCKHMVVITIPASGYHKLESKKTAKDHKLETDTRPAVKRHEPSSSSSSVISIPAKPKKDISSSNSTHQAGIQYLRGGCCFYKDHLSAQVKESLQRRRQSQIRSEITDKARAKALASMR